MSYEFDKPVSIKEASKITGIPEWKLRVAIKAGLLKQYNFHNSRKLVRVSDIAVVLEMSVTDRNQNGGDQ